MSVDSFPVGPVSSAGMSAASSLFILQKTDLLILGRRGLSGALPALCRPSVLALRASEREGRWRTDPVSGSRRQVRIYDTRNKVLSVSMVDLLGCLLIVESMYIAAIMTRIVTDDCWHCGSSRAHPSGKTYQKSYAEHGLDHSTRKLAQLGLWCRGLIVLPDELVRSTMTSSQVLYNDKS